MIITKSFMFTNDDIDSTILEVAEEIKKGYKVQEIRPTEVGCSSANPFWRPKWTIVLRNKEYRGDYY